MAEVEVKKAVARNKHGHPLYPKWKYHKNGKARIVKSEEAEALLGEDWADSVAEFGVETAPGVAGAKELSEVDAEAQEMDWGAPVEVEAQISEEVEPSEKPRRGRKSKEM